MGEFYHDILWRQTGQLIEEPLLWDSGQDRQGAHQTFIAFFSYGKTRARSLKDKNF
jgi:hypothetical protein